MDLTDQQKTDAEKALLVVLGSWGCSRHKDDFPMLQSELAKVGLEIGPIHNFEYPDVTEGSVLARQIREEHQKWIQPIEKEKE